MRCMLRRPTLVNAPSLTERQKEVLKWVAQGKSYGDVGEVMDISRRTVIEHMQLASCICSMTVRLEMSITSPTSPYDLPCATHLSTSFWRSVSEGAFTRVGRLSMHLISIYAHGALRKLRRVSGFKS